MAETPLAASMPPDRSLSSSFLENVISLVKRRLPKQKASSRQQRPENTARVSQFSQVPAKISGPSLCCRGSSLAPDTEMRCSTKEYQQGKSLSKQKVNSQQSRGSALTWHLGSVQPQVTAIDPHGESLGEYASDLDKQLKEIEREIEDLLEFWEHVFEDGKEDRSPEIPSSSKSCNPHGEPIPQVALREYESDLDKQLKKIDREIEDLLEFWEHCFEDGKEDTSPEIPSTSKWHLGHPLDMNDEYLREDPSYNEEQVEQEALRDYLQELEEQQVPATCKQAASQKRGRATSRAEEEPLTSEERPTTSAKASASLSQGRLPALRKRITTEAEATREEVPEESGSPSSSSEEEEDTIRPKRNLLRRQSTGMGKAHRDRSCRNAETSPCPSRQYNFRRQSKAVSYVSQQEEEEQEQSWSEGSCGKEWSPSQEGSDGEEEEESEGGTGTESGEELEAEAGLQRRKALKKPARSYRCPTCSREFSNSSNMRKHLRLHEGTLPYDCHACGKSYADPSNLAKHQRMHTGDRRHECPLCPKAFYEKCQLEDHLRSHRGIRPFACLECQSSFFTRASLLYHMKIHVPGSRLRQPPVHCKGCHRTFTDPKGLRRHRKRQKNLRCEDCGEAFCLTFKYRLHRRMRPRLCRGSVWNMERPEPGTLESSAAVPQGVVAGGPPEKAAPPRGQEQPISSPQGVSGSSGANRPTDSAGPLFLSDGQVRPSDHARVTRSKAPSPLPQASVPSSQPNRPSAPVGLPVLDDGGAKPPDPVAVPPRLKPAGVLLQNAPAARPVQSSLAVAKPFAQTPSSPGPSGPVLIQPSSQSLVTSLVLVAAPSTVVLLTGLHSMPLIVTTPPRLTQPSGSDPVSGAASLGLILQNPATSPQDTKVMLESPSRKTEYSITLICAACQTKYVGKHSCKKFPQDPAEKGEEEPREKARGQSPQPSPVYSSCPQVGEKQEMLATPCSFLQSDSQVSCAQSGEKEPASDLKGDCEFKWVNEESTESKEIESPEASKCPGVLLENRREPRQKKQRKDRYMCSVCDKRFVHRRSFRNHMRLHLAFSHVAMVTPPSSGVSH